jgi:hypothetical protein
MPKLKSHKTVEQIARKHRLEVSFIQKQLDMGEPIEHEHTKDHKLAMDIALQHLDEIPDYYSRLKKMEADAKKNHKKYKDVKEDYGAALGDVDSPVHMPPTRGIHADYDKRYCPKCKKVETRSECKYGSTYWDIFSMPAKLKEHLLRRKLTEEDPCWKGYTQVGMKLKNGKKVPNCVPSKGVSKAKNYKEENTTIEDLNGDSFAEIIDLIQPDPIKGFKSQIEEATRLQSQTGNVIAVTLSWRAKYYSLRMFFPQAKLPTRKDINDELQKVYPGCNVLYHSVSEIQPGQPLIQAFGPQGGSFGKLGPNKNYVKTMGEDWQKVNRQDKTDGLSPAAVKAYRRENPGSKLQTAVTEKNPEGKRAERRKSFCSRMSGMKKRLTSAETARDPDSRINKALRRWNCN